MGGNGKTMTVGGKQLPPEVQDFWEEYAALKRIQVAARAYVAADANYVEHRGLGGTEQALACAQKLGKAFDVLRARVTEYQEKFGPATVPVAAPAEGGA